MKVIGLVGRMGSGKSTVANYLTEQYGFKLVKFADPLKDMLRAVGIGEEEIEGHLKNEPCDLLMGKTPRFAMQTLGTQWGRESIHPQLWVRLWLERAGRHNMVVCDDCRFPNEATTIRENGGKLIRIIPDYEGFVDRGVQHESEAHAMEMDVDLELLNDGSITQLCQSAYEAIWE